MYQVYIQCILHLRIFLLYNNDNDCNVEAEISNSIYVHALPNQ